MLKLRITPLVAVDLNSIKEYIAEDNPDAAQETVQEIYKQFENIQIFPNTGQIWLSGLALRQIISMFARKLCGVV